MSLRIPGLPRVGIRALLIILLLPGVVVLLVIDSLNDYRTLSEITNEAYDSALVEPARVLESSLEFTPDGNLQVATPLYAQVMLESRAGLRKYFRIEQIDPPHPGRLDRTQRAGQDPPGHARNAAAADVAAFQRPARLLRRRLPQ